VNLRPPPGIRYAGPFKASTLGEWSAETPADADEVVIDMSKAAFIDSMGLATIAAVAEDAANCGRALRFIEPQHHAVRTYMSRMHLDDCLRQYFCSGVTLPKVNERDTGHRLFELQRFDTNGGDELAERVFQAMVADGSNQADAIEFFKGISEVVNNVADHSGAGGGWAAMQVMPSSLGTGLINFAVADAGHGFETTLSRRYWVSGPVDAMAKAFQRTVSGTGEAGRGAGLDDLHQRIRRHQGSLTAWSGAAIGQNSGSSGPLSCRRVTAAFPGTVIYAGFKPSAKEV